MFVLFLKFLKDTMDRSRQTVYVGVVDRRKACNIWYIRRGMMDFKALASGLETNFDRWTLIGSPKSLNLTWLN